MNELQNLAQNRLSKARVTLVLDDYDRRLLAKMPPAVFVCNRLLPGLDEWVLLGLMSQKFEQARILHPYPSPLPKSLKSVAIKPAGKDLEAQLLRLNFAKKITRILEKGASVGLVIDFSDHPLSDLGKNLLRPQILKQLRKAGLPIIPVHLSAERLPGGFLRRAIPGLPYQFTHEPVKISVRLGSAITKAEMDQLSKTRLWGKFLQAKIFSLGSSFQIQPEHIAKRSSVREMPLADPAPADLVASDILALPAECKICSRGPFDVLVAPFSALPNTMFEIGRLRELTFRSVGEGTGKSRDLDEHDIYYLQLIIWDREAQKIVGGYRLGQGDQIFKRFGINGFYTHSLFKMEPGIFPVLQHAVELGRTYVTPDYQRHRLSLFLLWKGILHFLLAHPQYRYLIGPVSISKYYSEVSKGVIVEYVKRHFFDTHLAQFVQPRKPFRAKTKSVNTRLLAENMQAFEALEHFVEDAEPRHFPVPVLLRQYLKQNARFIAFNVDPNFSNCLDGLMLLDIKDLPAETIETLQQEK
ncbi:MAG: GNAT family N-acetyltransferase [Saprospiraceae bacterium]|nr:GNAT family N-acetyltransferase [Saprospiraceae bacterium]